VGGLCERTTRIVCSQISSIHQLYPCFSLGVAITTIICLAMIAQFIDLMWPLKDSAVHLHVNSTTRSNKLQFQKGIHPLSIPHPRLQGVDNHSQQLPTKVRVHTKTQPTTPDAAELCSISHKITQKSSSHFHSFLLNCAALRIGKLTSVCTKPSD